jgi:hypothetical protein
MAKKNEVQKIKRLETAIKATMDKLGDKNIEITSQLREELCEMLFDSLRG